MFFTVLTAYMVGTSMLWLQHNDSFISTHRRFYEAYHKNRLSDKRSSYIAKNLKVPQLFFQF